MTLSYWRLAIYGVILMGALWVALVGFGGDEPGLPQPGDGIPVILFISSDGALRTSTSGTPSETILDPVDLPDVFAQQGVAQNNRPVVIIAHENAPSGQPVQVMDYARRAGAPSVTLVVAALD